MKKQAQINQVFVWLIIALVIGATALFGVRSIGGLLNDKCSIDLIKFEEDIRERTTLNNDFRSVHQEIFSAPCDYTQVCFVDARAVLRAQTDQNPNTNYIDQDSLDQQSTQLQSFLPLLESSVSDGVPENIFLFNDNELIPSGYVPQIRLGVDTPDEDEFLLEGYEVLCLDARAGRFTMIMEGLGRNTWIQSEDQYNDRIAAP